MRARASSGMWLHGLLLFFFAFTAAAAVGCTALPAVEDARTGFSPRLRIWDETYHLDVAVVDPDTNEPVDGILVRLTGVEWLNRFHDHPVTDFSLHAVSGEAGEPGRIRFRFPAPPDFRAFDLYLTVYNPREDVTNTYYYPGDLLSTRWMHGDIPLEQPARTASVVVEPYNATLP